MSTTESGRHSPQPAGSESRRACAAAFGPFGAAITNFTKIIETASDREGALAYKGRATAYAAAGEYRLALADRIEVVRRDPRAVSYYERGLVYLLVEDYHNAAADFRKVLEFADHPGAHSGLALAYKARGDLSAALSEINKAIAISPHMGGLYAVRAGICLTLGNIGEALADLDSSLAVTHGDAPLPRLLKGKIFEAAGRPNDAISEHRHAQALVFDPQSNAERILLEESTKALTRLCGDMAASRGFFFVGKPESSVGEQHCGNV